jgi:hypothetical protein
MWMGFGLVALEGIRAGRRDAISQDVFLGNFDRKGCGGLSELA